MIVQLYFESNCSIVRTQRAFIRNTGDGNHPSPRCIRLIVAKFKAPVTIAGRQHPGRSRTVKSIDNVESVRQDVTHSPRKSVIIRSEELQISKTSWWLMLREDLECYPYTIQLVQKIGQNDTRKGFNLHGYILKSFSRRKTIVLCWWLTKHISLINRTSNIGEWKIQEF